MTRSLNSKNDTNTIKFLYSYGGKIVPRRSDGKLCYVGGYTRIIAVDRSITFAEIMVKFGELCGSSMSLKCKLPSEDLDVLVSIKCDGELVSVIEEYDRVSSSTNQDLKIRAVLFPLKSLKKISLPPSPVSSLNFAASKPTAAAGFYSLPPRTAATTAYGYIGRKTSPAVGFRKNAEKLRYYPCCVQGGPAHIHVVPQWNHWQ